MRDSKAALVLGVVLFALALALVAYLVRAVTAPAPSVVAVDAGEPDAGRAPPPSRVRADARPDILLVTIGTLRADHVSAYGYDRRTTPTLDALARRGTLFRRAYSTSSWAIPAVASLLSGVLPAEHGALHGHLNAEGLVEQEAISPELPWLPVALHDAGYRTVGISASSHFDPAMGYGRGFDDYEALGFASADVVLSSAFSRLDALRAGDAPFFLWVHVVDPHLPFVPVEPQFSSWWSSTRPRYPALDRAGTSVAVGVVIRRERLPVRDALEYLTAAYDSEIRHTDDFLDELLGRLDDGHLAVVVSADHGEELNDHHAMGHGHTIFEELIRVPLVVALPGQAASESTALVTLMDVFPTLLDVADAPVPDGLAGTSLLPAMRGESFPPARDVIVQTGQGRQIIQGIFDGRYKYGERVSPSPVEGLFDLEADPFEQHDALAEHPEIAGPLRQRLHDTLAAAEARRPEVVTSARPIPEALREQVEGALGGAR